MTPPRRRGRQRGRRYGSRRGHRRAARWRRGRRGRRRHGALHRQCRRHGLRTERCGGDTAKLRPRVFPVHVCRWTSHSGAGGIRVVDAPGFGPGGAARGYGSAQRSHPAAQCTAASRDVEWRPSAERGDSPTQCPATAWGIDRHAAAQRSDPTAGRTAAVSVAALTTQRGFHRRRQRGYRRAGAAHVTPL